MPARAPRKPARSRREWLVRGALAILIAAVGYICLTRTMAQITRDHRPQLALNLAPGDARAKARLALDLFMESPNTDPDARSVRLARAALKTDPTALSAAVVLGLQADLRGDRAAARRFFSYSQRLSRRDLPTHLWAIEDAVGRGDIAGALRYYDMALRTSRLAAPTLFPILTAAVDEPRIRTELVRTFAGKPPWQAPFIAHAIANSGSPDSLVALFDAMRAAHIPVVPEASASLVNRLVLVQADEPAWRYYASYRPGVDRRRSRNPRFADEISNPSSFDWNVNDTTEASAVLQTDPAGGALIFSIPPNGGGVIATQQQLLPPGRYRLTGQSSNIAQDERSLPYWTLKCRDGRQLLRVQVPNSKVANGHFGGDAIVPADCPAQTLALVGQSSETIGGTEGQIDRVSLLPAT